MSLYFATDNGGKEDIMTRSIFSSFKLGSLILPNRMVMAPMTRNRAGPGEVRSLLAVTYYTQRASAGLIITEGTQISQQGQGYPGTPGIS
jgi:N-ethylmaleimide reductase